MNSFKIGTLVITSFFALNSFAQVEVVRPTRVEKTEKVELAEKKTLTVEQEAELQTEKIHQEVTLSSEQRSRVYDINLMVNNKIKVIHESKEMTREYKSEALKGNEDSRTFLIRETLNEEQKVKWDQLRKAEKAAKKVEHHNHEGHDHDGHQH